MFWLQDIYIKNFGRETSVSLRAHLCRTHIETEDDIEAVLEVLKSDWLTTGPKIGEFESAFASATDSDCAVAVSSGTAALHTAMFGAGIGSHVGDEVIVPGITFVASANAAIYLGAKPVFADVDPDTLLIDPADVRKKITPNTKAIVSMDYGGQPCDYQELRAIADEHSVRRRRNGHDQSR